MGNKKSEQNSSFPIPPHFIDNTELHNSLFHWQPPSTHLQVTKFHVHSLNDHKIQPFISSLNCVISIPYQPS